MSHCWWRVMCLAYGRICTCMISDKVFVHDSETETSHIIIDIFVFFELIAVNTSKSELEPLHLVDIVWTLMVERELLTVAALSLVTMTTSMRLLLASCDNLNLSWIVLIGSFQIIIPLHWGCSSISLYWFLWYPIHLKSLCIFWWVSLSPYKSVAASLIAV